MSALSLQRVVVRMLHDPAFAAAVLGGRDLPELSADEHALLRRTDPRAFRTDPYRRSRLLTALLAELPASAALAAPRAAELDAFLSSPGFHACIMARGSLAEAFVAWITPRAGPVALLEGAVARARRETPRAPGRTHLQRAPGLVPVTLPEGTVARWQDLRQRLGADPVATLVAGNFHTRDLPAIGPGTEHLLVEVHGDDAGLSFVSEALVALLQAADHPQPRDTLVRTAADLGAGDDAAELIADLLADGTLVPTA